MLKSAIDGRNNETKYERLESYIRINKIKDSKINI